MSKSTKQSDFVKRFDSHAAEPNPEFLAQLKQQVQEVAAQAEPSGKSGQSGQGGKSGQASKTGAKPSTQLDAVSRVAKILELLKTPAVIAALITAGVLVAVAVYFASQSSELDTFTETGGEQALQDALDSDATGDSGTGLADDADEDDSSDDTDEATNDDSTDQADLADDQISTDTPSDDAAANDTDSGSGDTSGDTSGGSSPDPIDTDYSLEYWNLIKFTDPPTVPGTAANYITTANELNFNWGTDAPVLDEVQEDYFVLRATKQQTLPAGAYTFNYTAEDGIRIYVDGDLIVDRWNAPSDASQDFAITEFKQSATIVVEFYDSMDEAALMVELVAN